MMKMFPFRLPMLLDGSTGVMLSAAGMPEGACTEKWALDHPDIVREIQRGYVQAGSQAVYAPTFCANRVKLKAYGLADRVGEMNRELTAISRDAVGKDILVGGDMAPLGLFLKPFGETGFDELIAVYQEQAEALESAGVDFFIAETLMSLPEARAAVLAIRRVSDKPIFVTITCDESGRMLSGTPAEVALVVLQSMGIDAFGLNCSVGPDAMVPVMERLKPYAALPLIVKPNAGLPEMENGHAVFRMTPEEFTKHTQAFADCGVRIFGGCCGTDRRHISALAKAMESVPETLSVSDMARRYCASERELFPTEGTPDFGEQIVTSEFLADDLMDAEDSDAAGIWVHIADPEGLNMFEENQYQIKKPLLISAEDGELLSAAFAVYQGRAACREEDWQDSLQQYGAVRL